MAKTESTAVNELIDLVNKGKPLPSHEPGADLFAAPAPLPRSRAPQATREQPRPALPLNMSTPVLALPEDALTNVPLASSAGIRVSTNVPSRGTTIPSLAEPARRASSPKLPPPHRATGAMAPALPRTTSSANIVPPPVPSRTSSAGIVPPPVPSRTSSAGIVPPPVPSRTSSANIVPPPVETSPFAATPRRAPSPNLASAAPTRMPAGTLPPPNAPIAAPFERTPEPMFAAVARPRAQSPALQQRVDETWVGVRPRRSANVALAKKLAIPALACIGLGVGLGFYVSRGRHAKTAAPVPPVATQLVPAPQMPPTETVLHPAMPSAESPNAATASAGGAMPEPPTKAEQAAQIAAAGGATLTSDAPAAALAQAPTTKQPMAALVDVRIDTQPAGASITLLDRGMRLPLGSSPLATSLDPSRQYDLVIEADGHAAQTVHVDPTTTTHVALSLDGRPRPVVAAPAVVAPAQVAAAPAPAPAPKTEHKATALVPTKRIAAKTTESTPEAKPASKAEPMAADASAPGTLMVSAKPPCELVIDGAATGLRTPQKSIELAPGRHRVQFVNAEQGIDKTVTVTIKPGAPTKLIEDLMK